MSTQNSNAPQPTERDRIALILQSLVDKLTKEEQKPILEADLNLSDNYLLRDLHKLDNINWEKWSRQTIRNLKGFDLLYVFKGLEEEEFKEAMEIEKSPRQLARDESNAIAIIRAGLTEEDKELTKNAETAKAYWTLLKSHYNKGQTHRNKYIFADLAGDMGKQWKVGDRASSRWYSLRTKISNYQGMDEMLTDPTTDSFLAMLIVKYWITQLPNHIAKVFEKQIGQASGHWNDVMERIDADLERQSNPYTD
ncbi:hypothetical protein CFIMG_008005RA00001 [Ceratocystis fimbriata CBS 114723]|uniref:Uncharacterized protein n=1 Tax=Ceratocystis fimbriata CBS 114723 TaxID=1035309 RepID=A0A2C5WTU5_9PEZI|nr:hypothetical protein CFIMG_008005RA00001 [Ceratocystis fimbriata CBS 114723]